MTAAALAARLATLSRVQENGTWQRHVAVRYAARALEGHTANGRWGTSDGFPVLYLGRPMDSVTIEAYRHYVDVLDFDSPEDRAEFVAGIGPRVLVACSVTATNLLDLRSSSGRAAADLTLGDLQSTPNDPGAYGRCRTVSQVAHQLGFHGIIAPAATRAGETLALFTDKLPTAELPTRTAEDITWSHLPPDPREAAPRSLRIVSDNR